MFFITFKVMAKLLAIICVAYVLNRKGIISDKVNKFLTIILVNIIVPANIVKSFNIPYEESMKGNMIVFILLIASFIIIGMIFGYLVGKLLKMDKITVAIFALAMGFTNNGYFGFPLITTLYGGSSELFVSLSIIVSNTIFFTSLPFIFSKKLHIKNFTTPSMIACIIGLVIFTTDITLPSFVSTSLVVISKPLTTISLFVCGGFLAELSILQLFEDERVYKFTIFKMFVYPFIAFIIAKVLHLSINETVIVIALILNAMPVAINVGIFTKTNNGDYLLANKMIFITTVVSLFALPLQVMIFSKFI